MALYQTETYTTTGTKASKNCDPSIAPFAVTVAVTIGTTGSYTVQYSLDPSTVADASSTWFDSTTLPSGTTASGVASFISPVAKVRIAIAAVDSTIKFQVSQGFTVN
jgi:hypothetical protein